MDLVGNILIAPPSVKGNFWYKTVIIITEHYNHGSIGIVLNKRSHMTIEELCDKLGYEVDIPGYVYVGGPVNSNSLSLIHSNDWMCKNTMRINDHVSISSADDIIPRLSQGDTPKYWRLFFGLCGWGPGQLINEIKGLPPYQHNTSWCTATSNLELIFESLDNKNQWNTALDQSGLEFAQSILS